MLLCCLLTYFLPFIALYVWCFPLYSSKIGSDKVVYHHGIFITKVAGVASVTFPVLIPDIIQQRYEYSLGMAVFERSKWWFLKKKSFLKTSVPYFFFVHLIKPVKYQVNIQKKKNNMHRFCDNATYLHLLSICSGIQLFKSTLMILAWSSIQVLVYKYYKIISAFWYV